MDISISSNIVTIAGNIKTIQDFQDIKTTLDSIVRSHKSITINILDSMSITSSVIGYFNKLILKDNVGVNMRVGNEKLVQLLSDLNLSKVFNVQKI